MKHATHPALLLRQELAEITKNWGPEDKPSTAEDIFFPDEHLRALALDRPLVIGMRGAGKSFWSEVLTNETLREQVEQHIDAYRSVSVVAIRWDQQRIISSNLPESTSIERALRSGMDAEHLWLCVVLQHLRSECLRLGVAVELPNPESDLNAVSWDMTLDWGKNNVDRLKRTFSQIETLLNQEGRSILVVIDALDRMSARLSHSIDYLRGVLKLLLDARQLRGLRFKVFLRNDMASMPSVLSFPDASKLLASAVHLKWSREEIYALHWRRLAQYSSQLKRLSLRISGQMQANANNAWEQLFLAPTEKNMRSFLEALASPYMGKSVKKGATYAWWFKHLADGKDQVSPRTFAASLKAAIEQTASTRSVEQSFAITHLDIKEGIRSASAARVAELGEDYFWVKESLKAFEGKPVPADVPKIYGHWNGAGVGVGVDRIPFPQFLKNECLKKEVFLPWDDEEPGSPSQKLRDTLIGLGILVLRNDNTRLDIPDIYRVGYGIGKHGGLSPR
jgi:hypothetical protein